MRPKLRTLVQDVYKDISYVLDDDNYSAAEYQDVVRKRFIKSWESLADGYKVLWMSRWPPITVLNKASQDTFSESNYRLIFGLALDVLLRPWEKYVMGLKFTEVCLLHVGEWCSHYSPARRYSVWPRHSFCHHLSLFANSLWRRKREVHSLAADVYIIKFR